MLRGLVLGALLLTACPRGPSVQDGAAALPDAGAPGIAYESCTSLCVRPGDCFTAYPDDAHCPNGFRCLTRFSCAADGGAGD